MKSSKSQQKLSKVVKSSPKVKEIRKKFYALKLIRWSRALFKYLFITDKSKEVIIEPKGKKFLKWLYIIGLNGFIINIPLFYLVKWEFTIFTVFSYGLTLWMSTKLINKAWNAYLRKPNYPEENIRYLKEIKAEVQKIR